jgi:GT2 family glycosyltransferase
MVAGPPAGSGEESGHPDGSPQHPPATEPGGAAPEPYVDAVVVAYGDEPWLEGCVESCLASQGARVRVVLVDNGCTDGAVDRLDGRPGVRVVRPGTNLGFAAGCNLGVDHADAPVVALVNPDTRVEAGALAALAGALAEPDVGIATCSLRLADRPESLNSAGNEVHFLGLSWSGAFEEPASAHLSGRDVMAASGAGMAIRRDLWEDLGGFVPEFFAYQEDAELSVRCWQHGLRVRYVPQAVIVHRYEFSRNPEKFFLLDRNRLILVLTLYGSRTLALLSPLLVLQEVAMFAVAGLQGWFPQRLRSVAWLVRHRRWLRERRARLQAARRVGDGSFAPLLATVVQPGNHPLPPWAVKLQRPLVWWWAAVRRRL